MALLLDAAGKPIPDRDLVAPVERVQANTCGVCGAHGHFQEVTGFGGLSTRYCLKCGAEAKEN